MITYINARYFNTFLVNWALTL